MTIHPVRNYKTLAHLFHPPENNNNKNNNKHDRQDNEEAKELRSVQVWLFTDWEGVDLQQSIQS